MCVLSKLSADGHKWRAAIASYLSASRMSVIRFRITDNVVTPIRPEGDLEGGIVATHPMLTSSNGSPLPGSAQEVIGLYRMSIPERYLPYVRLDILDHNPIPVKDGHYVGRYAPQDENTEKKTELAIKKGRINPGTDVVAVDTGGPHSIAAGRALAQAGFLILPSFRHGHGRSCSEDTATLLYFAKEIAILNTETLRQNPDPPWALILDCHREYDFADSDLPPISKGCRLVYMTEAQHPPKKYTAEEFASAEEDVRLIAKMSARLGAETGVWSRVKAVAFKRGVPCGIFILGIGTYYKAMPEEPIIDFSKYTNIKIIS